MSHPRRVRSSSVRRIPVWLAVFGVLAACSGEGPGASTDADAEPTPSTQCDATGAIEGGGRQKLSGLVSTVGADGELTVSDVRVSTVGADVIVDGTDAPVTNIKAGDIVTVTGAIDLDRRSGCATKVFADADVTGAIESLDVAGRTLTILGQQITVTPDAVFGDGVDLASLQIGDRVRVSGLRSIGTIVASRIDVADLPEGYFISGLVTGLDIANQKFLLNQIAVEYNGATLLGFPAGGPRDGDAVRVTGTGVEAGDSSSGSTIVRPARVEYIDYGAPLSVSPSRVWLLMGRSIQFLVSGQTGQVTWRVSKSDGTSCSSMECGEIDATGRYSAPLVERPAPGLLVTATSVADPRNRASAVVLVSNNPPTLIGTHTLSGEAFASPTGSTMANVPVDIWVQQPGKGESYWFTHGPLYTNDAGLFEAPGLPDALVSVHITADGHVQPCAVTRDVRGDVAVSVELQPVAAFDALEPPRPQLAVEPSLSGQVFETTPNGREPIAGAELWLEETLGITYARTISDRAGRYFLCNIGNLPTAAWVTVGKADFETVSIGPVNSYATRTIDIELKRH